MVRVSLTDTTGLAPGRCEYVTQSIFCETQHWYNQNRCQYVIGQVTLTCTAWREILTVDAYLPREKWSRDDRIRIPDIVADTNFVIEERLDSGASDWGTALAYSTQWSPSQRLVHVRLGVSTTVGRVYVSPHRGLILGACVGQEMELSDLLFIDVGGL